MSSIPARTTAVGFVVSGLTLAAYPLLRPWGVETGAAGALTYAKTAWPLAHLLGMVGFVTLALALRGLVSSPVPTWTGRGVRTTETLAWLAAAFLLPYYGAEAYGLHALGTYAAERGDAAVLAVADSFRYGPVALTTFTVGLLLLLVVGVRLARGFWSSGTLGRLGGTLAAAGAVTYLPQFFGTPAVRIAHGLVLGTGLVLLGLVAARTSAAHDTTSTGTEALVGTP